MFRLIHASDLHFSPLPAVHPLQLMNKRLLGYLSWSFRRKNIHQRLLLDAFADDVKNLQADHICLTGDFTNLGLKQEYDAVQHWLDRLAPQEKISVIPGNHDAYIQSGFDHFIDYLQPWSDSHFPYLHRRGPLAIIGVSSAVATGPFQAWGRVDEEQLVELENILTQTSAEGLQRVVCIHHPPEDGIAKPYKELKDALRFREVIARAGAELILHGHMHRPLRGRLPGPGGYSLVFGAGSLSLYDPKKSDHLAHYHIFDFREDGGFDVTQRVYDPNEKGFRTHAHGATK